MNTEINNHIKKAITLLGNQTKLASAMGVDQAHVSQWLNKVRNPSPENAVKLNQVTNGEVRASDFYSFLTDIEPEKVA